MKAIAEGRKRPHILAAPSQQQQDEEARQLRERNKAAPQTAPGTKRRAEGAPGVSPGSGQPAAPKSALRLPGVSPKDTPLAAQVLAEEAARARSRSAGAGAATALKSRGTVARSGGSSGPSALPLGSPLVTPKVREAL